MASYWGATCGKRLAAQRSAATRQPSHAPPSIAVLHGRARRFRAGRAASGAGAVRQRLQLAFFRQGCRQAGAKAAAAALRRPPPRALPGEKRSLALAMAHRHGTSVAEVVAGRLYWACGTVKPADAHTHIWAMFEDANAPRFAYWNFFLDFGPLNLGQLYRFCQIMSNKLRDGRYAGERANRPGRGVATLIAAPRDQVSRAWVQGRRLVPQARCNIQVAGAVALAPIEARGRPQCPARAASFLCA